MLSTRIRSLGVRTGLWRTFVVTVGSRTRRRGNGNASVEKKEGPRGDYVTRGTEHGDSQQGGKAGPKRILGGLSRGEGTRSTLVLWYFGKGTRKRKREDGGKERDDRDADGRERGTRKPMDDVLGRASLADGLHLLVGWEGRQWCSFPLALSLVRCFPSPTAKEHWIRTTLGTIVFENAPVPSCSDAHLQCTRLRPEDDDANCPFRLSRRRVRTRPFAHTDSLLTVPISFIFCAFWLPGSFGEPPERCGIQPTACFDIELDHSLYRLSPAAQPQAMARCRRFEMLLTTTRRRTLIERTFLTFFLRLLACLPAHFIINSHSLMLATALCTISSSMMNPILSNSSDKTEQNLADIQERSRKLELGRVFESLQIIQTKLHRRLAWRYAALPDQFTARRRRAAGTHPPLFAFACEVEDRYRVLDATPRISAVACTNTNIGALPLFCFRPLTLPTTNKSKALPQSLNSWSSIRFNSLQRPDPAAYDGLGIQQYANTGHLLLSVAAQNTFPLAATFFSIHASPWLPFFEAIGADWSRRLETRRGIDFHLQVAATVPPKRLTGLRPSFMEVVKEVVEGSRPILAAPNSVQLAPEAEVVPSSVVHGINIWKRLFTRRQLQALVGG
ncbi:hypothetical protein CCUS01_05779 [Colletotrichum cuscutae]|uniref:Uncharacterized protein n=1 Tax=Colletotrichum cuscutae TaxID=1209917 RepID=A0AAI9Y1R6_9PEZI|nr:hypothetical protein CCUS01_05779 [Colletotrichum cuscutae]